MGPKAEARERALVVRRLIEELHRCGIDPDEGFVAEYRDGVWTFAQDVGTPASSSPALVRESDAKVPPTGLVTPQKR